MAEMNRLCEPKDGEELTGLTDPQQTLQMAHAVADAANQQAVDFLHTCGAVIESHFSGQGVSKFSHRRGRAFNRENWEWGERVHHNAITGGWFSAGLFLNAPRTSRSRFHNTPSASSYRGSGRGAVRTAPTGYGGSRPIGRPVTYSTGWAGQPARFRSRIFRSSRRHRKAWTLTALPSLTKWLQSSTEFG